MAYRFNCRKCKEFVYIEKIEDENTNYVCKNCNSDNWLNGKYEGFEEIDKEDIPFQPTYRMKSEPDTNQIDNDLIILKDYKFVIGLLMLIYSGYVFYTFYKLSDYLSIETALPLAVNYIIILVICLSIMKIISFLNK
tara:strand:+ start:76 stop:486 length:411 start_codon:yes stop_codon:yes gene_type:complete